MIRGGKNETKGCCLLVARRYDVVAAFRRGIRKDSGKGDDWGKGGGASRGSEVTATGMSDKADFEMTNNAGTRL